MESIKSFQMMIWQLQFRLSVSGHFSVNESFRILEKISIHIY